MAQYRPPQPLNFVEPNWDRFISQFQMFRLLTELDKKSEPIQIASLKYCMGPEAEDVFKTFNLSEADAGKYELVVDKYKGYFSPRKTYCDCVGYFTNVPNSHMKIPRHI